MAGQLPIVGGAVQVYAAGTTGSGSSSTPLLTTELTTDAGGAFTVTASYNCPTAASQLYIVVLGGKVGTATNNSAISLATAIGECNQITTSSQFAVNEVTTAASVWGLNQFIKSGVNLGASTTNVQGFANAVATVANLVNIATGTSPGPAFPTNGSSPAAKINTLANLLNTCTSAATPTPCTQLFTATTPNGSAGPDNTFDAALNLVRNPGTNVTALYKQSALSSAFAPALTAAPSDWTLFIKYTGGGMNSPASLGVDAVGNVWVASYFSDVSGSGSVAEFTPTGTPVFANGITGNGLFHSYGLAVDAESNVWIANQDSPTTVNNGLGSVTVVNSGGQLISGATGFTAGGLDHPTAIAIDTNANSWVVDYGDAHVTVLSSSGAALSGSQGYTSDSLAFPVAIAIDANHNAWIGDQNDANITRISSDGTQSLSISCCNGPVGLAVDSGGNVWSANFYGNNVSELSSSGAVLLSGATGGGLAHPQGIAIDGNGSVWVANFRGPSLTQFAGSASNSPGQSLSPAVGWAPDAELLEAYGVAIDASGNLWVTSFGSDSIVEFVGVAGPVKTPLIGPSQAP